MKHAAFRALALFLLPLAFAYAVAATRPALAQSNIQSYALLNNASASGPLTFPAAGNYQLSINGTFGGATLTLTEIQTQGGASATLGTYTSAPASAPCLSIPAGVTLQMTIAGGAPSALNAILGGVGSGGCAGTSNAAAPLSAVTPTNGGSTITVGGTAQNAIAANTSRKGGWCQNPVSATEDLFISTTTSATTTGANDDADLAPGASFSFVQSGLVIQRAISVNAATTAHRYLCVETQ